LKKGRRRVEAGRPTNLPPPPFRLPLLVSYAFQWRDRAPSLSLGRGPRRRRPAPFNRYDCTRHGPIDPNRVAGNCRRIGVLLLHSDRGRGRPAARAARLSALASRPRRTTTAAVGHTAKLPAEKPGHSAWRRPNHVSSLTDPFPLTNQHPGQIMFDSQHIARALRGKLYVWVVSATLVWRL